MEKTRYQLKQTNIIVGDIICKKCRNKVYNLSKKKKENSKATILTANGSRKACIICLNKSRRLHEIKSASIIRAYLNHKILIRPKTRCCKTHLDENGLVKKDV